MNYQKRDVLQALLQNTYTGQRELSTSCGHSLGAVNNALKQLSAEGYLNEAFQPTPKAYALVSTPQSAVILAAGFGMRMVPINTHAPKGLLEVHGQTLIERLICQLQQVGIRDIRIVVGYMKEQFEYLIDSYGVCLICNPDYAGKNNLHSLYCALPNLRNCYIVPSDIWCRENPFRNRELYSWYLLSDRPKQDSPVHPGRDRSLSRVSAGKPGNTMIGIAYLTEADGAALEANLKEMAADHRFDNSFWEEALRDLRLGARVLSAADVLEINTYEQLRELDSQSDQLRSDAIDAICSSLQVDSREITQITVLKKGMTNRSFLFCCRGKKYIMRIPGEGTDQLINRVQEADVYQAIADKNICDNIAYINPLNGYKITEFLEGARVCDPESPEDVAACMARLRRFHESNLQVAHTFDIFGQILFYESLWNGQKSVFRDYQKTKDQVLSLQTFIDSQEKNWCLTHIDAVPDNFLFAGDEIRLIDWEYAGMQDPHVDIAMFCIYAMYDRAHIEQLIDAYFPEGCPEQVRTKIYCYISACGLLWSNWCEYKRQLGVEFGEYSLQQYRFAKDYYRIAKMRIQEGDAPCTK